MGMFDVLVVDEAFGVGFDLAPKFRAPCEVVIDYTLIVCVTQALNLGVRKPCGGWLHILLRGRLPC